MIIFLMILGRFCKDAKIIIEDAYSEKTASTFENNFFDYIIEDGLHTVEYQTIAIKLWLSKLKKGGKLIIEDILLKMNYDLSKTLTRILAQIVVLRELSAKQ